MFHSSITIPADAEVEVAALQRTIALLAAGLDTRFVQAGSTLADAIAVIDRIIAALDGVTNALDERRASAAVDSLDAIARHVADLPATQAARSGELATLVSAGRALNTQVMDMHQALRVLRIYGTNIKIAASGEPHFVAFVDGMAERLGAGEQHLDGFLAKLKELMAGAGAVQQAERLLAAECVAVLPHVPERLANAGIELRAHLGKLADMAARVAVIARDVQQRIATVLGALQIGDITRQRLEHVVAALELLAGRDRSDDVDPIAQAIVRAHCHALLADQLDDAAADFERESDVLLGALRDLGPETGQLLALMDAQYHADGRGFLQRLETGISDVQPVIARLGDAGDRSTAMAAVIADVVDDLSERIDGLRRVRLHVQDISTNTRLLCRRFGAIGKAVSVIATEVDIHAARLGDIADAVVAPIGDLSDVSVAMRGALDADRGATMGMSLGDVLGTIREGCQRSERGVREACDDARQFIGVLQTACADLTDEMGCTRAIQDVAARLALPDRSGEAVPDEAEAALRATLDSIAGLYTMAQERVVHDRHLLPGMARAVTATIAATASDDDLFDDALF